MQRNGHSCRVGRMQGGRRATGEERAAGNRREFGDVGFGDPHEKQSMETPAMLTMAKTKRRKGRMAQQLISAPKLGMVTKGKGEPTWIENGPGKGVEVMIDGK